MNSATDMEFWPSVGTRESEYCACSLVAFSHQTRVIKRKRTSDEYYVFEDKQTGLSSIAISRCRYTFAVHALVMLNRALSANR